MARPDRPEQVLTAERAELTARLVDLARDVEGIVAATADANTDDEHDPEGATIAWEREQATAVLARARARLADVDAALARVRAGTYGTCVRCGCAIGTERLTARPAAGFCVGCARSSSR